MTNHTWLLANEAAKHIHMDRSNIYKLFQTGEIRAYKRGKNWFTTAEWLDEYIMGGDAA